MKTLYVSSIKQNVSQEDLQQYFSRQGTVSNLVLHDKGDYKYAFVTFATYEDANEVLKKRTHFVKRCKLRVRPADTWHQPKHDPSSSSETKNDTEMNGEGSHVEKPSENDVKYDENAPSLMILNDDCLLYLLEFFNVLDLIKIRGTCTRLDTLIDRFCQKYVNFDFGTLSFELPTELTLMNARDILSFLGPNMKSLKIDGTDFSINTNANRSIEWISRFCKNLDSLELENFTLSRPILKKLTPVIQNLKSFSIGDSTKVGDELGTCFNGASRLEEVKISGNWEITGKCLKKVSNLKSLSVNCCGNLQPKPFKEALEKNTTLKKLEICRCDRIDDSIVNFIVDHVQGIEELSMSNIYPCMSNYSRFAELPHLKKLSVEFHRFAPIDDLLKKLSTNNILEELRHNGGSSHEINPTIEHISKLTNLKVLSMAFNSNITDTELKLLKNLSKLESLSIPGAFKVTADGLLSLLSHTKYLKFLDVSQIQVDDKFLEKVIHMWKQESRPKLEIILYETKICEDEEDIRKLQQENAYAIKMTFSPKILNTFQFMFNASDFGDSDADDDDFFDIVDDDDDDDMDGFGVPPWELYGDQWWDSDDSDKYMYGWGQYSGDRSPVGW